MPTMSNQVMLGDTTVVEVRTYGAFVGDSLYTSSGAKIDDDLRVTENLVVGNDASVGRNLSVVGGVDVTEIVTAEHLHSTDDASVADSLNVGRVLTVNGLINGTFPDSTVTDITAGNGIDITELPGNDYTISTDMTAFKCHREADTTFVANTWTDIRFDMKVADESLPGCAFSADSTIVIVTGFEDIFFVGGCVHYDWTGNSGTSCSVYTRILYSIDSGSNWIEARCLQTNNSENRGLNAEGTQNFTGTLYADDPTWVKLQVRVTSADMELSGATVFDNPVAATLYVQNIGDNE